MEKIEWCQTHVGDFILKKIGYKAKMGKGYDFSITTFKGLTFGDVLVDDYPPYISDWAKMNPSGKVIIPINEMNKNFFYKKSVHYKNREQIHSFLDGWE